MELTQRQTRVVILGEMPGSIEQGRPRGREEAQPLPHHRCRPPGQFPGGVLDGRGTGEQSKQATHLRLVDRYSHRLVRDLDDQVCAHLMSAREAR